jgi:hypothetical protein
MNARSLTLSALAALATVALLSSCSTTVGGAGACSNADGALDNAAFVFVQSPRAGSRVNSGFTVSGCSRTFESNVVWSLKDRAGSVIASGHTSGGGVDGPGPFSTTVAYSVSERQVGHLEVFEVDASDGEGYPPGRHVIPLVLQP